MGLIKARLNTHFINQHQDTRWTFGAQKLFGINAHIAFTHMAIYSACIFCLLSPVRETRTINQIFN